MLRTLLEIPLLWFAAAFAVAWLLLRRAAWQPWVAAAAGAGSVLILLLVAALNVLTAGFVVSFGANVVALAAAHGNGQPMYHPVGGPQLYTLVYGPYTYLVYEPFLRFHDSLTVIKVVHFCLVAVTLLATFLLVRARARSGWQAALALTGFASAVLLAVPAGVLGIRGDLWAVLAFTLGLLAVQAGPWWLAAAGAGLCCGFAVDSKATLAVEAVLLLVLLWRRHGSKAAGLGAAFTILAAGAPFVSAHISLRFYLQWLLLSSHRDTFLTLLVSNVLFAVFLLAPAALVLGRPPRLRAEQWLFAGALLVCICAGAKSGGGPWHLWPLLPFVLASLSRRFASLPRPQATRVSAAIAFASLVVSARWGLRAAGEELPLMIQFAPENERKATAELLTLSRQYRGRALEMAPGSRMSWWSEDLRYVLVVDGQPYDVDLVAAGEALKTDPALLPQLAETVADCRRTWVVPDGETPFSTANNNETRASFPEVFPQQVQAAFLKHHRLVSSGEFYDTWACSSLPDGGLAPSE